jgi:hypothetical protein
MIVVPDTNAFYGDPKMHGHNFRVLLSQHDRDALRLAVPEVVLGELPGLFRDQLASARKKAEDGLGQLDHLGIKTPALEVPSLDAATEAYRLLLRARLQEHSVLIPQLPDVDIAELYDQATRERRPFQDRGRGFKDALIWRTVCDLAMDDDVILITANHKDFAATAAKGAGLHEHLQEDLVNAGLPADRVGLVENISAFIAQHVPTSALHLEQARRLLDEDPAWARTLFAALEAGLRNFALTSDVTVVASDNAAPTGISLSDCKLDEVAIEDAYTTDERHASLELLAITTLQFEFTTSLAGGEWLGAERADVELDFWTDSFVQGHTGDRVVAVRYAVDFDPATLELGVPEQLSAEDYPADG